MVTFLCVWSDFLCLVKISFLLFYYSSCLQKDSRVLIDPFQKYIDVIVGGKNQKFDNKYAGNFFASTVLHKVLSLFSGRSFSNNFWWVCNNNSNKNYQEEGKLQRNLTYEILNFNTRFINYYTQFDLCKGHAIFLLLFRGMGF